MCKACVFAFHLANMLKKAPRRHHILLPSQLPRRSAEAMSIWLGDPLNVVLLMDLIMSFLMSFLSRLDCMTLLLAILSGWETVSGVLTLHIRRPYCRTYVFYYWMHNVSLKHVLFKCTCFPTPLGRLRASMSPLQDASGGRLGRS